MKIAIGADHGGYKLKEEIKKYLDEKQIEYVDLGAYTEERTDYPIFAEKVAKTILSGECNKGIIACRSGAGVAMVANKFKGIRAASVHNEVEAKFVKSDDNMNVITLGGDYISVNDAICIIRNWLAAEFKGGRYQERLDMLAEIEKENMK